MIRISNTIFICINIFPFLLGVVTVVASIYFHVHGGTVCQNALRNPLLIIGLVLFVVSLLAFIGSCCCNHANLFLTAYSISMVLVVLALTGLTIFVIVITNKGVARRISRLGFSEYHLEDYSGWLRENFVNHNNWDHIRSCLSDSHVCQRLHREATFSDFIRQKLSLIQGGCCKPPTPCGFQPKNETFWEVPKSGAASKDPDCLKWSNNHWELCYECNSCKGGVLDNLRKEWRSLAIINIILIVFFIFVYSVGCCARRSNHKSNKNKYIRGFA
ncbi:hypothetical protein REPUB_Repub07fG0039600 [Reevesia pubescens]